MRFLRFLFIFVAIVGVLLINVPSSMAIYDPLSKNNNYFGIHILFPSEIESAAQLINSSGGDWGYVTIPIQVGDKDMEKWQKFMDDCARLHVIPLVRLATEPDHEGKGVWRKPEFSDIIDFANFLDSLKWPTKNRYVILFNEVNRYDEWGGESPNPGEYAQIVDFSVDAFKSRSSDFYMILGGMDNAAPTDGVQYMNHLIYLQQMASFNQNLFDRIDGFSSHSYPNPNFAAPPLETPKTGVASYRYEYELINKNTKTKKLAFITETGWNGDVLPESVISQYFQKTLDSIWGVDKDKIVAITPFLLQSHGGFDKFSFTQNGAPKQYYKTIHEYAKTNGTPEVLPTQEPLPSPTPPTTILGVKTVHPTPTPSSEPGPVTLMAKAMLKAIFGLSGSVIK